MAAQIFKFICRKELFARRGTRNFGRYMRTSKGFTPHTASNISSGRPNSRRTSGRMLRGPNATDPLREGRQLRDSRTHPSQRDASSNDSRSGDGPR